MKKILLAVSCLLLAVSLNAQVGWVPNNSKNRHIGLMADSLMYMPVKDTNYIPQRLGAYTMRPQDSCVYVGIKITAGGAHWAKMAKYSDIAISIGIDGVLAIGQSFTTARTIPTAGFPFYVTGRGNISTIDKFLGHRNSTGEEGYLNVGYGLAISSGTAKVDSSSSGLSAYFLRRKDSVAGGYYPYSSNPLGYVLNTRSIATGYGLAGGGDLSANRTHVFDSATVFTQIRAMETLQKVTDAGATTTNSMTINNTTEAHSKRMIVTSPERGIFLSPYGMGLRHTKPLAATAEGMGISFYQNASYPGGTDTILNNYGYHFQNGDLHQYLCDFTNTTGYSGIPPNRLVTFEKGGLPFVSIYNNPANDNAQLLVGFYPEWAPANYYNYRFVAGGGVAFNGRVWVDDSLGIGTEIPAAKFHAVGTSRFDIGSDATGDIFYRDASGFFTRLPIGTTKQKLGVVGGLPAWVDSTAVGAGAGTVTNTGGNLTSNSVVLGAGTVDTKVVAGITTDGTSVINLGVNATTIGKVKMFGNTSGDVTIQPTAAAGTATVQTLPATTGTLANRVTTANGVSASNTDGALSFTLGAITPSTVNGNTITTGTGVLTIGASKTFTASNTLTLTATDGSTLAIGGGGTLGSNAYTSIAYAPLASPTFTGTVVLPTPFTIGAVSMTATGTQLNYLNAATGTTGTTSTNLVFSTSPTLVTPALGTPTALVGTNITGTAAAFNINGTVGATTPAAGTFTTVVAGSATSILVGTAGSAVGSVGFRNATSGTATIAPPTGALGTYQVTLPNAASTLPIYGQQITYSGPTAARTVTYPDASFTVARTDAANTFTGVQTMTSPALTTPAITGLATGSGVSAAATASTIATRDANANISANNWIGGYTTTATAAGTTTLTVGSTYVQFFTGSTTQTITLPVTSTLTLGHQFVIVNNSTGLVTINSSGSNAVVILAGSTSAVVTCILTSGTSAASWSASYSAANVATGKKLTVSNTITFQGTDATIFTLPGASRTLVSLDGTETLSGKRVTKRTGTTASSGTPTINTDNTDVYLITALAANITSFTTNLSGSANLGDELTVYIKDNGTSRTIAWGASFEDGAVTLPTATTISTTLVVKFYRNIGNTAWMAMSKSY